MGPQKGLNDEIHQRYFTSPSQSRDHSRRKMRAIVDILKASFTSPRSKHIALRSPGPPVRLMQRTRYFLRDFEPRPARLPSSPSPPFFRFRAVGAALPFLDVFPPAPSTNPLNAPFVRAHAHAEISVSRGGRTGGDWWLHRR